MKPSSFKRPRLPSGTPPKPAPRPAKKDLKKEPQEEKKEEKGEEKKEEKPAVRVDGKPKEKKEEKAEEKKEEKPEVKEEEKQEEIKALKPEAKNEEEPDGKKEEQALTGLKKEEAVEDKEKTVENVSVEEGEKKEKETKKEDTEAKEGEPSTEEQNKNESENVDEKIENGETHNIEKKDVDEIAVAKDDLWVKRDSGKEALRPGGRSMSLKIQRSTSGTEKGPATSVRSATLPKPWSPGQAPSSMLSRKLSWEMPKAGGEDVLRKKERSGSTSGEPIPEDSEDQSS